jgi:hypothetical protein
MNPLPLLLLAGGGIVLLLRKGSPAAGAQPSAGPPAGSVDPTGTGDWVVTPATPPAGFRRVLGSEVTPALTAQAKQILTDHGRDPIGTEVPFELEGKQYLGVIELHYHEPGGPLKPWGAHHGVSLFVETS